MNPNPRVKGILDILEEVEEKTLDKSKHIHKYQKFKTSNGKILWRCILPSCKHSFYGDDLIMGREMLCNGCNKVMILPRNKKKTLPVKPVCDDCRKIRAMKYRPYETAKPSQKLSREDLLRIAESLPE